MIKIGKKKKDIGNKTTAKQKHGVSVDERLKKISSIEPPEVNLYKQDNEKNIDMYLRNFFRGGKPKIDYSPVKLKKRMK